MLTNLSKYIRILLFLCVVTACHSDVDKSFGDEGSVVCGPGNLHSCSDESSCFDAGGLWSNGTCNNPSGIEYYPSTPLPDNFVSVFFPVSPIEGHSQKQYVSETASIASQKGLDAITLILFWRDIEKAENVYDFDSIHSLIKKIKSTGLHVILRIYFNAGSSHQAMPDWLVKNFDSSNSFYDIGQIRNPLPWDKDYQEAVRRLLAKMANYFNSRNEAYPDAIQVSAGGEFGEMAITESGINLSDNCTSGQNCSCTNDKDWEALVMAEQVHIDSFKQSLSPIVKNFIFMINSMQSGCLKEEIRIPNYAIARGITWIQSNAGACFLHSDPNGWGDDNIQLLKHLKTQNPSTRLALEDEDFSKCSTNPINLTQRIALLYEIKQKHQLSFDAIHLTISETKALTPESLKMIRDYIDCPKPEKVLNVNFMEDRY